MPRVEFCGIERIASSGRTYAIGKVVRRSRAPSEIPIREAQLGGERLTFIDYGRTWTAWSIYHPLRQAQARDLVGREFDSLDDLRAAFPSLPRRPETAGEMIERVIAGRSGA
jgi:hypothetical protein